VWAGGSYPEAGVTYAAVWYRRQFARRTEYRFAAAVSPGSGVARAWAAPAFVYPHGYTPVPDRDDQYRVILQAHTGLPRNTMGSMFCGHLDQSIPLNYAATGLRACVNDLVRCSGHNRLYVAHKLLSVIARLGWKASYTDMDRIVNRMTMDDLYQFADKVPENCRNLVTETDAKSLGDVDLAVGKWAQMILNQIPKWVE